MRGTSRAETQLWDPEAPREVRPRAPSNENLERLEPEERFGPYVVLGELGLGAMASVHRAEKRGLNGFRKTLALKRLWPHLAASPELVEAFVQEARIAGRLRCLHIPRVFDHGRIDGTLYIAMELVPGPTLAQVIAQLRDAGAMPVPIAAEIVIQLCDALAHAHGQGVIHREVAPRNLIVASGGIVKLIDFGIAKAPGSRARTQHGVIEGTFGYVAPEAATGAATGAAAGAIDHRVDLFAAGAILHELLAGQPLFVGANDAETLGNVLDKRIAPPSRWNPLVSPDLDDIVMTALQRDPARRWRNAGAMAFALRTAMRELCGRIDAADLHAWMEWAFSRPRRADTVAIGALVDSLLRDLA